MQTLQRSRYNAPVRWFTSINHSLPQMSKFSLEVMNMHNDLRALHGVGPLTLSEEVITWNHSKTIVTCAQYLIWLKHTKNGVNSSSWAKQHKGWRRKWLRGTRLPRQPQSRICRESTFWDPGHLPLPPWWERDLNQNKGLYFLIFFQLSATEVVEWWYNEAAFHDYHSESQNSRSGKLEQRDEWPVRLVSICSGNFSQMIWSASKALGVGYAR